MDFKSKTVARDKEIHQTMTKRSIHQYNIKIINVYVPSLRASKYSKQILTI